MDGWLRKIIASKMTKWKWSWTEEVELPLPQAKEWRGEELWKPEWKLEAPASFLVLSDSHGCIDRFTPLLADLPPIQAVLHAGDLCQDLPHWGLPIYAVQGNCDLGSDLPLVRLFQVGKTRIFLSHGHRYGVKSSLSMLAQTASQAPYGAQLALYGHTHIQMAERLGEEWGRPILTLNPGSWMQGDALLLHFHEGERLTYRMGYYQRREDGSI